MLVIIPVCMHRWAKCHLECQLLARIAVKIEPEGVKPFLAEGVRSGQSGVGIDSHRHHRRCRPAGEKIKVAEVDTRVFACGRGVEMMRHRQPFSSVMAAWPDYSRSGPDSRRHHTALKKTSYRPVRYRPLAFHSGASRGMR